MFHLAIELRDCQIFLSIRNACVKEESVRNLIVRFKCEVLIVELSFETQARGKSEWSASIMWRSFKNGRFRHRRDCFFTWVKD
jgi:hypothetical protein